MAEIKTLHELFKHICGVARVDYTTMKDWYEEWKMNMEVLKDFPLVMMAWTDIKNMPRNKYPDPYFDLSVWTERVNYHFGKQKIEREAQERIRERNKTPESPGISYPEIPEAMGLLINGKITRGQFAISCERKGFDMSEYREFIERKGYDLSGYASGLLGKRIDLTAGEA